jgi:hypothetical protein
VIGRRRASAPAPDPWEDEGRRLASQLGGVSAAVIVARDASVAARVALGAARAVARARRVAVADLVGGSTALSALAGHATGPGIVESFQQGISLNDVARPAADGTRALFILPHGAGAAVPEEVLQSDRWRRLAAGFAEAGALLLIAARAGTPSLDALVMQTDGVVAIGDVTIPMEWRVIAQAGDAVPASPAAPERSARRPRRVGRALSWLTLIAAATAGIVYATRQGGRRVAPNAPPRADTAHHPPRPSAVAAVRNAPPIDTVGVSDPVNPPDSAAAARFAVELVATNTASGANSWLREHAASLPGATVSPVPMGAARTRWYKVIAGASRDRAGADSLLAALRAGRIVRAGAGMVVRVPLALLLEADVPRGAAAARIAALAARDVQAYALVQDDGSARVFAGAFETAAAAVVLDAELRAQGLRPQLVYRTGRTF